MTLTGIGLYAFPEASRLTRIPTRDLRRWLSGYTYRSKTGAVVSVPPLWQGELANKGVDCIGFRDLLEVRFVQAFRLHGVSLQSIRLASHKARGLFGLDYPFTARRFRTDGRSIFASALEETGETRLLDIVRGQYAFRRIVEASLYHGIEFDDADRAMRWYPMPRSRAVVLDPKIAFGEPIVTDGSVPTTVLYNAFRADRDRRFVARVYEVPVAAVEAAIAFEEQLAA
ncbi:MAG: DUF433 domain-containing protein [Cupriavidus necator]